MKIYPKLYNIFQKFNSLNLLFLKSKKLSDCSKNHKKVLIKNQ